MKRWLWVFWQNISLKQTITIFVFYYIYCDAIFEKKIHLEIAGKLGIIIKS